MQLLHSVRGRSHRTQASDWLVLLVVVLSPLVFLSHLISHFLVPSTPLCLLPSHCFLLSLCVRSLLELLLKLVVAHGQAFWQTGAHAPARVGIVVVGVAGVSVVVSCRRRCVVAAAFVYSVALLAKPMRLFHAL